MPVPDETLPLSIVTETNRLGQKYLMTNWGATSLIKPITFEFYRQWIETELHGEMSYLKDHLQMKEDPKKIWPHADTALVFIKSYTPHPQPSLRTPKALKIARYAQGNDYHLWFKSELQAIATELQNKFPNMMFLTMTDSAPVLERDLAQRAGLGWFGKNTCLIDRKHGSLFFIGEIYTNIQSTQLAELMPQTLSPDFCGKCNRCIEACPTQAISRPHFLEAEKCISYLTIESKTLPPMHLREKIGDWFFGCDICQVVCPWNQKIIKSSESQANDTDRQNNLSEELKEILSLSGKALEKKFYGTALQRARPFGLRRNAIIVATNLNLTELLPDIVKWIKDPRLEELVQWSQKKLHAKKQLSET